MTREELKNEILERLEMVDDGDLIEYYNDTHEAKIYRDIDDLFDEHCTCFAHALECLAPGFNYSPYGGYYGWNDGEICSADCLTELIDMDDIAEIMLVDMESSLHTASGYGDIDDITEELLPELKKIQAKEVKEKINLVGRRIAELAEEREARANEIRELFERYEELMA